jgi:hypothetical protein
MKRPCQSTSFASDTTDTNSIQFSIEVVFMELLGKFKFGPF